MFGAVAHAATYVVTAQSMPDLAFVPQIITIVQHDQITFVNGGGLHNVRADNNSFWCSDDCSLHRAPSSKLWVDTVTFNTIGTFGYYCEQHGDLASGMRGTIVVIDEHIFADGFGGVVGAP
jgi:plastocyanin